MSRSTAASRIFTILTGSGADTITTGAGDDIIKTGEGAGTITASQGANEIVTGGGEDTITALDGGNVIDTGDGTNTVTTGGGVDLITTGRGYALTDSPAGQAAWIYEKFAAWTDRGGVPESVLSRDAMLDDIMLYWLPGTAASSARLYYESFRAFPTDKVTVPVACSIFPRELFRASRRWAEKRFSNLVHWNELDRGGHFAAFEQPALFVEELRAGFRSMR